ncbi:PLDc_N domain-containing protein [Nonomuraea sp. FMUSA5-5]|uniref:PLDc_N domain-containing protein n=1 Tax=Nonomuraea composti TaxID=2720023 RepID=A0ABX1BIC3_9ACTN|nr:PLD nuclease N-terminal domain-containing protein [Nonomuraea sp. FMUSA5-5]NJP96305.1 PLDc_N domain-containing protein [Nonomuraea sp. FMUSA5-5]
MRWEQMSKRRRGLLMALVSTEMALTTAAAVDLAFSPKGAVRGSRGLWWLGIFVQPIGPIAYLLWGRRHSPEKT